MNPDDEADLLLDKADALMRRRRPIAPGALQTEDLPLLTDPAQLPAGEDEDLPVLEAPAENWRNPERQTTRPQAPPPVIDTAAVEELARELATDMAAPLARKMALDHLQKLAPRLAREIESRITESLPGLLEDAHRRLASDLQALAVSAADLALNRLLREPAPTRESAPSATTPPQPAPFQTNEPPSAKQR